MNAKTINISLPPELLQFVRERVEGGLYASASEVVRDGLRQLQRSAVAASEADEFDRERVARALEALGRLAETQELGDELSLRELIDEGRP